MEFSKVLLSGAGFLADAYDLFVINIVVDIMDKEDYHQEQTDAVKATVKAMALIGAVVGQLFFGATADLIGRRIIFITTCALVIIGALGSATVSDSETFGIYSQLSFWRFILGVGVGGEYPLSAAITSESSSPEEKIKNLAKVFSMQGFGTLLCSIVLIICTQFVASYDTQWRIALGFGGVPMAIAFYFRWKMHETSWAKENQVPAVLAGGGNCDQPGISNLKVALLEDNEGGRGNEKGIDNVGKPTICEFIAAGWVYVSEVVSENRWKLLGTAGSWLILDIVFYANGLFSGQVTTLLGAPDSPKGEAVASLILQSLSLPGYLCTITFIDKIGAKRLQDFGFAATAFFFCLLSVLQPYLKEIPTLYVILYGLTFFFQNFGPNATTYIIPSIIYKTSQKATCHGISAAAGKVGAIFGAYTFLYMAGSFCSGGACDDGDPDNDEDNGLRVTFAVCGALAIFGLFWSMALVSDEQPSAGKLNDFE